MKQPEGLRILHFQSPVRFDSSGVFPLPTYQGDTYELTSLLAYERTSLLAYKLTSLLFNSTTLLPPRVVPNAERSTNLK